MANASRLRTAWAFASSSGAAIVKLALDRLVRHIRYGHGRAFPRFRDAPHGELHWEVPAEGLDEKHITKMMIDRYNVFLFKGETNNGRPRADSFQLPKDANFEKAKFKAWMKNGMINVTATGFEKEDVSVTFK